MKKAILALVLALTVGLASAQEVGKKHHYTLAGDWDLPGASADNDIIVAAVDIEDEGELTIAAQPDTPRPLVVTIVDADDSTSCILTIVGTLADGSTVTSTVTFEDDDTTYPPVPSYNFATVTSATLGVCTGEAAGDTIQIGTTSTIPTVYYLPYGTKTLNSQGKNVRNHNDWLLAPATKRISNDVYPEASTVLASTSGFPSALSPVVLGDLLLVNLSGEMYELAVVSKSDDDEINVDTAIAITSSGVPYRYRHLYYGPDTDDGAIPVGNFVSGTFVFIVTQLGDDLDTRVQCRNLGAGTDWVLVDDTAFTAAGTRVVAIDFRLAGYDQCRAGLQFATSDAGGDSGAEAESITIQFVGVGRAGE